MIREILAPFERVTYVREDGNQAVYKVFRPTKHLFINKKKALARWWVFGRGRCPTLAQTSAWAGGLFGLTELQAAN
jgi:hypothetical protein